MVYYSLYELAPPYMQDTFHKLSDCRNRALRNTETDLKIPRYKKSNGQRSFSYRGVTVWNQLSTEIKTAPSLAIFKNRLKIFLKIIDTSQNEDYHIETSVWSIFLFCSN